MSTEGVGEVRGGVGWAEHEYRCNGLSSDPLVFNGCKSDRVSQTVNYVTTEYALDTSASLSAGLASSLTQVLADDDGNRYLYGVGRIGEEGDDGWVYHHGCQFADVSMPVIRGNTGEGLPAIRGGAQQ